MSTPLSSTGHDYAALLDGPLRTLPQRLRHEVLVPLSGGRALLRATVVHPAEWTVLLGGADGQGEGGYWIECTVDHARDIAKRRLAHVGASATKDEQQTTAPAGDEHTTAPVDDEGGVEDALPLRVDQLHIDKGMNDAAVNEDGEPIVNLWEEYDTHGRLVASSVPSTDEPVDPPQPTDSLRNVVPASATPKPVPLKSALKSPSVPVSSPGMVLRDVVEHPEGGKTVLPPVSPASGYVLRSSLIPSTKRRVSFADHGGDVREDEEDDDGEEEHDDDMFDDEDDQEFLADLQEIEEAYYAARQRRLLQGTLSATSPAKDDEDYEDVGDDDEDASIDADNMDVPVVKAAARFPSSASQRLPPSDQPSAVSFHVSERRVPSTPTSLAVGGQPRPSSAKVSLFRASRGRPQAPNTT